MDEEAKTVASEALVPLGRDIAAIVDSLFGGTCSRSHRLLHIKLVGITIHRALCANGGLDGTAMLDDARDPEVDAAQRIDTWIRDIAADVAGLG